MSRWQVNTAVRSFEVESLAELKKLAKAGDLVAGDLIQPPGSTQWVYALEVPDLKGLVPEDEASSDVGTLAAMAGAGGILAIVLLGGAGFAWWQYSQIPSGDQKLLGEGGLFSYSEMLVLQDGALLLAEPKEGAPTIATLKKDNVLQLLAKRGDFYKARAKAAPVEGWIKLDLVLPMYQLGGNDAQEEYDPLYNPDRYVQVSNASWSLTDDKSQKITVFQFQVMNESAYPLTDLKLTATVKDGKGAEIEKVEFPVKGVIPAKQTTMMGTLMPEDKKNGERELWTAASFAKLAVENPDIQLRWVDGVEVEMQSKDFATAKIEIVEIRAVPENVPADVAAAGGVQQ